MKLPNFVQKDRQKKIEFDNLKITFDSDAASTGDGSSKFLPMVRNDFYAIDTFRHRVAEPYPVPLSVMCGTEEQVPDEQLTDWQHESSFPIRFERRPGHHFWIFEELEWLAKHIKTQLKHG